MNRYFVKMASMSFAYSCCFFGLLHAYFFYGVRTTFIESRWPGTEPGSTEEYIGNLTVQTIESIHGIYTQYYWFKYILTQICNLHQIDTNCNFNSKFKENWWIFQFEFLASFLTIENDYIFENLQRIGRSASNWCITQPQHMEMYCA